MKISVSDKNVTITWTGCTKVCEFDEVINMFKSANDEERRRLAVNMFDSRLFRTTGGTKSSQKRASKNALIDLANTCDKFSDYDFEQEIDDIIGCDPYLPLY